MLITEGMSLHGPPLRMVGAHTTLLPAIMQAAGQRSRFVELAIPKYQRIDSQQVVTVTRIEACDECGPFERSS